MYKNLLKCPILDLHGETKEISKVLIKEFIEDNKKLKNYKVLIIHGIGNKILMKTTQEELRINNNVESYKIDNFNIGQTIVIIKK